MKMIASNPDVSKPKILESNKKYLGMVKKDLHLEFVNPYIHELHQKRCRGLGKLSIWE